MQTFPLPVNFLIALPVAKLVVSYANTHFEKILIPNQKVVTQTLFEVDFCFLLKSTFRIVALAMIIAWIYELEIVVIVILRLPTEGYMSNQQDKKRRKFNHDSVARSGHRKGSFSPDTRKPQTSNKTLNKTKLDNKKKRKMDVEEISRSSFTPGWNDSISREVKLSLPIKTMDGRIIQVKRITEERKESDFIDKSAVKDKSTGTPG